jgi:hypothetical protein
MSATKEKTVKTVLDDLFDYLRTNLLVNEGFISDLQSKKLIAESNASELKSAAGRGGHKAVDGLVDYMKAYYDSDKLMKFCEFLESSSEKAKPLLKMIATRIKKEMKTLQPNPIDSAAGPKQLSEPPGHVLSSKAKRDEPTSILATVNTSSQKIKEVIELYRNREEICLPRIPDLEDDFDEIMADLHDVLLEMDPSTIRKLVARVQLKYRRHLHGGVRPAPLPPVLDTPGGLYQFIAEKSTMYEIILVHLAIEILDAKDLKSAIGEYKHKLAGHVEKALASWGTKQVTLQSDKNSTHLALVVRDDPTIVLLSLVYHIKDYLKLLQLDESLFQGFAENCTTLFFSILREDAVLLAPKLISHLGVLNTKFNVTHVVVFGHFACDIEEALITFHDSEDVWLELDVVRSNLRAAEEELTAVFAEKESLKKSVQELKDFDNVQLQWNVAKTKLQAAEAELTSIRETKNELVQKNFQLLKDFEANQQQLTLTKQSLKITEEKLESLAEENKQLEKESKEVQKKLEEDVGMYKRSTVELAKEKDKLEV